MTRRPTAVISLVLAGVGFSVLAAIALQAAEAGSDVPPAFRSVQAGTFIEQYVENTLRDFRSADAERDGLDAGDIERLKQKAAVRARIDRVTKLLARDFDGDGVVTMEELRESADRRPEGGTEGQIVSRDQALARAIRSDRDGDGIITFGEMLQPVPGDEAADTEIDKLSLLIALDPNRDGRLTGEEMTALARGWFAVVDADHDGYLAKDEVAAFHKVSPPPEPPARAAKCALPLPHADDLVVAYGLYEGTALSSVSVAGQDRETSTSRVTIEPGSRPIFLVLSSDNPMVWRIEGATDRLARVVLMSGPSSGQAAAGITGIPAKKVAFADSPDCRLSLSKLEGRDRAAAAAMLEGAFGRPADRLIGEYSAESVALPSGVIRQKGNERPPAPPGFEEDMWRAALRYDPDGVVMIDPQAVVSASPAERYEVLPHEAGLAQLIGDGSLVRMEGGGLRIARPLKRFPAGLAGAHTTLFLLSKGVPLPPGDSGHSCVISEETGRPLTGGQRCG